MLFKPTHQLHILSEDEFSAEIAVIEDNLSQIATKGEIASFDGCKLAYEYFLTDNAIGSIVLIHGFTEFYKKLYEMTWYFLNMGYNVFLYDQRGHGLSQRDVDNPVLTHVNDFNDYVMDLGHIIDNIVIPNSANLPVFLMGHSMGGAVASIYLSKNSDKITRAILSSPMVCPKTHGIPTIFVKNLSRIHGRKNGWKSRFCYSSDFNPNPSFEYSSDSSPARFKHNLDYRINNSHYQNSSFTNRWMYEALRVKKIMMNPRITGKITTEVLIFSAQNDKVVHTVPHKRLAKLLPKCTLITLPHAKHTLYTGSYPMLEHFYTTVFDFLSSNHSD